MATAPMCQPSARAWLSSRSPTPAGLSLTSAQARRAACLAAIFLLALIGVCRLGQAPVGKGLTLWPRPRRALGGWRVQRRDLPGRRRENRDPARSPAVRGHEPNEIPASSVVMYEMTA